jgi:hypothetical protein
MLQNPINEEKTPSASNQIKIINFFSRSRIAMIAIDIIFTLLAATERKQPRPPDLSILTNKIASQLIEMGTYVIGIMLACGLIMFICKKIASSISLQSSKNRWEDKRQGNDKWFCLMPGYRDRFRILDKWETQLYDQLIDAAPDLIVFAQVSLPQMLYIKGAYAKVQMQQIGYMSVDFLVCKRNNNDISMIAAIELNGASHDRKDRQKADSIKAKALQEAGIPLIVYDVGNIPNTETIKRHINAALIARKQYEAERDARYERSR